MRILEWPFALSLPVFMLSVMSLMLIREEYRGIITALWIIFAVFLLIMVYFALRALHVAVRLAEISSDKFRVEVKTLDQKESKLIFEPNGSRRRKRLYREVQYFHFGARRMRIVNAAWHYGWSCMRVTTDELIENSSVGDEFYVVILKSDESRHEIEYAYSAKVFEYVEKIENFS